MQVGELFAKLALDSKGFDKGLDGSEKKLSKFGDKIGVVKTAIAGLFAGMTVKGVWNWLISGNASMEQYSQTLKIVLGDSQKAVETLQWAQKLAAQTPFEIPEIVEATTRLSAYGITAQDVLTDIGDMAAAMGKPLMQAVEAVADAQTGELERLKEFGITKQMLIDKAQEMYGKEIVNAKGQITDMEGLNDALIAIIKDRYSGAMAVQSTTLNGMISNLKDWVGTAGRILGDDLFSTVKGGLGNLLSYLNSIDLETAVDNILAPFKRGGQIVESFVADIQTKLRNQDWEGIGWEIGNALNAAIKSITGVGKSLSDKLLSEVETINWGEVGRNAVKFAAGFALGFAAGILDPAVWFNIISDNWQIILELLIGIICTPASWIGKLTKGLSKIPLVGKLLSWLIENISQFGKKALEPVTQYLHDLGGGFVTKLIEGLGLKGASLFPSLKKLLDDVITNIYVYGDDFLKAGIKFMERLGFGIGQSINAKVIIPIKNIFSSIDNAFAGFLTKVIEYGVDIVKGIGKGISSMGSWIKDQVLSFCSQISKTVKNFFGIASPSKLMDEYGQMVAKGFAQGIESAQGEPVDKAQVMSQAITDALDTITGKAATISQLAAVAFENLKLRMGETGNQGDLLNAQFQSLSVQLNAQTDIIALVEKAYQDMATAKGAASTEALKLKLQIEEERKKYIELKAAIDDVNQSLKKQSYFEAALASGDKKKIKEAAEVRAVDASLGGHYDAKGNWVSAGPGGEYDDLTQDQIDNWAKSKKTSVPGYANGGIIKRPVLLTDLLTGMPAGIAGESGEEAITPLDKSSNSKADTSSRVINNYYIQPGAVIIPAKDLKEMRDIQNFFNRFQQVARSM